MCEIMEAALGYAKSGWRVFPLRPASKMPNSPNGFKDATTDLDLIEQWWKINPQDNIGIATGLGLYLLDIDGPNGEESLNGLLEKNEPLPKTLTAITGKGRHFFFSYDGRLGNTASKLGKGIDTRGEGGYVVAPPSIHPDGRRYKWLNEGTPLAPLPKWIVTALNTTWIAPKYTPSPYVTNMHPFVRRVWESAQERLWNATQGCRNDELNREAFLMGGWIGSGSISRDTVESGFREIALAKGLSPSEISKTMESGISRGMLSPIYVPDERVFAHDNIHQQNARLAEGTINIQRGSSFGRSGVSFFWNKRIPLGKLTILAGNGGIGKSFLTLSLAAHVTAGTQLLDVENNTLDGEVLFCSYEDDIEDAIGPRADRLGVDLDRTHFITSVDTEHGPRDFGPQDVPRIIDYLKQCPEIKLIIIDPLGSFMGAGTDSSAENQMRSVLGTLVKAAKETNAAVIMVAHRNKQKLEAGYTAEDLVKSICGSQGIAAISRSVLLVERDEEDLRWVKHVKSNYARLCPDVSYTFDDDGFTWNSIHRTPRDLAYWLERLLKDNNGAMSMNKIYEWGLMQNRSEEEINIAQAKLGVDISPIDGKDFMWKLKNT